MNTFPQNTTTVNLKINEICNGSHHCVPQPQVILKANLVCLIGVGRDQLQLKSSIHGFTSCLKKVVLYVVFVQIISSCATY